MVMMTRSSYRKACESFDGSDSSRNNAVSVPPWCSLSRYTGKQSKSQSSKVQKRTAKVAPKAWEVQSAYPLRENIWEYLHEDKKNFFKRKKRTCCKQPAKKRTTAVISFAFLSAIVGVIMFLWISNKNADTSLITRVIPKTTLISLYNLVDYQTTSVDEECCSRMKHLAAALFRAEKALRSTLRVRRTLMLSSPSSKIVNPPNAIDRGYIEGITVSRGRGTEEWGSRVAMWGIVPLWKAAPPPRTVLTRRRPVPSDCWPFSGSKGELIFDLPSATQVRCVSLEHVRPDTALSAPRHFQFYGILANGTWVKVVDSEYKNIGPAKQYYLTVHKEVPMERFILRTLSNYGNSRYTCIYRVHLYASEDVRKM